MNTKSRSAPLLTLLLLVPLVFIVYFAVIYSSTNLNPSDIRLITLTTADGTVTELKNEDDISFFVNAVMDAQEISVPLRELKEAEAVKLVCDRTDKLLEYTVYPELSLSGCMLDKGDGKLYLLTNDSAKQLLSRPEFEYLYFSRFTQPLLLATGDDVTNIMPSTYEWKYRSMSGEYVPYTQSPVYDGVTVYSIYADRSNRLGFSVAPQQFTIELTDENGTPIETPINGGNISGLIFARDTMINVKVDAEWTHYSDSMFFGKATYSFRMLYDVPSTLTLSTNTVTAGDRIAVNVRYLNENEKVSVQTDLDVSPLAFSENNGLKTAYLAVDPQAKPGDYTLTFTIGGSVFTETVTVTQPTRGFRRLSLDGDKFERLLGEQAQKELDALIRSLNSQISPTAYVDTSAVLNPPTDSGKIDVSFGDEVLINIDGGTDSHAYLAIGNSYSCVDGAKVTAAAGGKIIYSGVTLTLGNLVVVDHGCGLQTWYYGIKTADRPVGSEVKAGDIIGFAVNSDYVSDPRIGFAASVCGMFVNP